VSLPDPRLLLITDRRQARRPVDTIVADALAAGARWISLREKDVASAQRATWLTQLVRLGAAYGAVVTVHEDVDAALAAGAAGVHLPSGGDAAAARRRLGSAALIGVSAHSLAAAAAAQQGGADYVTFSPIYETASKPGYGPALGPPALAALTRRVGIPVIALGGVTAANAGDCRAAGAAGIAVMGTLMRADDARALTSELIAALASPPPPG
jgi:thiamine-phosphate pyrophosphorylase